MKRLSNHLKSQFIIALFFILDIVIASKVQIESTKDPNQISQQDLSKQTSSILSNYHSDAENILRNSDNLENKSNPEKITNLTNGNSKKTNIETELKIVKRATRNYNFGLGKFRFLISIKNWNSIDKKVKQFLIWILKSQTGKRSNKQEQLNDEQIKELLNYLYNLDFNLILNYINSLVSEEGQANSNQKFANQLVDEDQDEKYKAKRDIQDEGIFMPSRFQQQRFQPGLGKFVFHFKF